MKWALVLSGGGARGLAHIGVIKELERRGFPSPAFVAGASMGAIIGAMYSMGWDAARMEDYARSFRFGDFMENPAFRLPDFALSRLVQAGAALRAMLRGPGLDSGSRVLAEFRRLFGDTRIEDMPVPFACTATDLVSGRTVVLDSGPLADALRISMSYPGVFAPVRKDDMLLVDGGILDNMPCDAAKARGFRRILASNVSPLEEIDASSMLNGMAVVMRCLNAATRRAHQHIDAMASLTVTSFDNSATFGFEHVDALIGLGQRSAMLSAADIERFFARGTSRLVAIVGKLFGWKRSRVR
ncbi:MAG: hypothetical protein CVV51_02215 [Spirochaetae bacterium HGW-Spirochaetae-7]|jgi:NTE family protein|nr:MAG: hypothetical protein CVV51_02215 [Spirochaetae bacterium HGW-Spirochaetae-7]